MGQRSVSGGLRIRPVPEWTVRPYAARSDCWGCGLPADVVVKVWPEPQRYCTYCDELRKVRAS